MRNAYKIYVRNHEGKKPLGKLEHGLQSNIITYLKEIFCGDSEGQQKYLCRI
jgi:hypothetical protein